MTSTKTFGTRLRECTCIADARSVLKEARAGPAIYKLVETAYALKDQDNIKADFIHSAIKEMDHQHIGAGEEDIEKKVKESGDIVSGSGTDGSEQSSQTEQPYHGEGTDGEVNDMKGTSGENQMQEGMPPIPQGAMPPVAPELMQNMAPQLPPGLNPAMMQQMQYTVKEALRPYIQEIANLKEGVKALDTRLKETETNKASMTLNVGEVKRNSFVRETTIPTGDNYPQPPQMRWPTMKLQEARNEIYEMDQAMNNTQ